MRLRSTPIPLAVAARASPAVRGREGYQNRCAAEGGAAVLYLGGKYSPLDYSAAWAPPTTSVISWVMAAWRARLKDRFRV